MLERMVNDLEKQLRQFEEEKNSAEKENINQNVQNSSAPASINNSNVQSGSPSEAHHRETIRKYDMAKRLCTMRNETIEKLRTDIEDLQTYNKQMRASYQLEMQRAFQENADLKASYEHVSFKYNHARDICDMRLQKLQNLHQKYGEPDPPPVEDLLDSPPPAITSKLSDSSRAKAKSPANN